MGWWQNWRQQRSNEFTPEQLLTALPKPAHSVIVHLGPTDANKPYYWQLRRQGAARDVALNVIKLGERIDDLQIDAEAVARFVSASHAAHLQAMCLLVVGKKQLTAAVLRQVSRGVTPIAGATVWLVVPADEVYDFVSGLHHPEVSQLLDGWPMKHASTLSAFVMQPAGLAPLAQAPLPAASALHYPGWQAADPGVVALFDPPLRQIADNTAGGVFVFTELD